MERNNDLQWENIDLFCILRTVMHSWWMIVLSALTGLMAAALLINTLYRPSYGARATLVVNTRSFASYSALDTSTANSAATTFTELLNSTVMRQRVLSAAGFSDFDGSIQVDNTSGSNLLTVTVRADTAREAFLVLHSITENHQELSNEVLDNVIITVLSIPRVYAISTLPTTSLTLHLLCALAAAAAMAALLAWLAVTRGTIQTEAAAKNLLDAHALAVIPHETTRRTGTRHQRIHITSPTTSYAFYETLQNLCVQVEKLGLESGKKVFLIASTIEHEGKSTITDNLALALSARHKSVLVFDCDYRKPSRFIAEMENKAGGLHMVHRYQVQETTLYLAADEKNTCFILFAKKLPENPAVLLSSTDFRDLLGRLREICSFILIDSPPLDLFSDGERLADLADASLLVVRQNTVPAPVINDAIDALRRSRAQFLGCVLNDMRRFQLAAAGLGGYGKYGYGKYGYGKYGKYKYGKYEKAKSSRSHSSHNSGKGERK